MKGQWSVVGLQSPEAPTQSCSSLAALLEFESRPHGVTSRHCNHSTIEPKERVGVVETPSSLWKSDIMSRYTTPAYKKPTSSDYRTDCYIGGGVCPVNSGPRGTGENRTLIKRFSVVHLDHIGNRSIKKLRSPTLVRGGTFGHLQHPLNFISFANIQTFSLSR